MKKYLLILSLLVVQMTVYGIAEYEIGDSLFVLAKSGLNIREKPDIHSNAIGKIPYGAQLLTQESKTLQDYRLRSISIFDKERFEPTINYKSESTKIK